MNITIDFLQRGTFMSEHTSIHFDPTALLIIKHEIDRSIKLVEGAVSTLIEEQTLLLVLMMH